jgi:hypothetical protein
MPARTPKLVAANKLPVYFIERFFGQKKICFKQAGRNNNKI